MKTQKLRNTLKKIVHLGKGSDIGHLVEDFTIKENESMKVAKLRARSFAIEA